ncbi:MAG: hypothetical protein ACYSXF_07720 [Planctomycetota bacterium]|jgi:hypothetical protein
MNQQDDGDILISRVVDGEGGGAAWDELVMMAEADPPLWRLLAEAQHDHAVLARGVDEAITVAETVEAPPVGLAGADDEASPMIGRIGSWSGWAVAALVCLVWATVAPRATAPSGEAGFPAQTTVMPVSAAEAFQAYLDKGRQERRVIGEIPTRVLVESRPAGAGKGYEVLYLRQVLERTIVPDLYRFEGQDERGGPTLVRLKNAARDPM